MGHLVAVAACRSRPFAACGAAFSPAVNGPTVLHGLLRTVAAQSGLSPSLSLQPGNYFTPRENQRKASRDRPADGAKRCMTGQLTLFAETGCFKPDDKSSMPRRN
jgi:hypothetical protein